MSEKIARLDKSVIDMVYPVGAIYMSVNSTNPGLNPPRPHGRGPICQTILTNGSSLNPPRPHGRGLWGDKT